MKLDFGFFRANVIGKNMKKQENYIEISIKYEKTIKSIGKVKKCAFVNVLLHFISSIK